ncbi:MAG: MFS transporter [Patescibacteria group bacterium]|nr:MFS transporter [Patescibacteria group bacterium]
MKNEKKEKVPKAVLALGLVSFFNDVGSEMVYPIVPIFLSTVLKASTASIGFIEGMAEATASFTKFLFGSLSDKLGKRKPFVVFGYFLSSLSRGVIGGAFFWPMVLLARFSDRLGKGLRTGARDALLLQNTNEKNKGYIFGFHRAFDSAGAMLGPILSLFLIYFFANNLRLIFYLAMIPGLIGVILLLFLVKEKNNSKNEETKKINFSWRDLDNKIKFFILISVVFALGNSSDAFLILRAKNLGMTTQMTVLVYVLYNLIQTFLATHLGKISDKIGHLKMYSFGLLIFSLIYFLFGVVKKSIFLWLLFPIYGVYIAATDGVSKAYLGEFIKKEKAGGVYGFYQMVLALTTFFASWWGGFLWQRFSPQMTFYFGSMMSLLAFLFLFFGKKIYKI